MSLPLRYKNEPETFVSETKEFSGVMKVFSIFTMVFLYLLWRIGKDYSFSERTNEA
jgi:hypothetical protein